MLEKILSRTDVKDFLHEVLNDQRFISKQDKFSPDGEHEVHNLYSLLTIMDAIIKFSIIIEREEYFPEYLLQLRRMLKRLEKTQDLEYGVNKLIGIGVARILNIEDIDNADNKKAILSYIYNKYIVDGYVFYGFNSSMKDRFLTDGIDPRSIDIPGDKIRQINHFFNNRGIVDLVDYNEDEDVHVVITDSGSLAYLYAIASPRYLCDICATNKYMDEEHYDINAFYRGDYETCRENIIKFSKDNRLSLNEGTVMLQTVTSEWNRLDITNSKPCIAFVKRSEVSKNYLKDIRVILSSSEKNDLVSSIGEILKSQVVAEKRYTPFSKDSFNIKVMPSYKELYSVPEEFVFQRESQVFLNDKYFDDLEEEMSVTHLNNLVNDYGKSTILGLIGMLMITLGATLIILFTYYN